MDCFPAKLLMTNSGRNGCTKNTGQSCTKGQKFLTDYSVNYKKWGMRKCDEVDPALRAYEIDQKALTPQKNNTQSQIWAPRYAFSRGKRNGVATYSDCTPSTQRSRFETTYMRDYYQKNEQNKKSSGRPFNPLCISQNFLCPFTNETTYARSYDIPLGKLPTPCTKDQKDQLQDCPQLCSMDNYPPGIVIKFGPNASRKTREPVKKSNLTKPGTDASNCTACPKNIPCCPCPDIYKICDACCGCEYPCKLHMAAAVPKRKYPIVMGTPRYVPDPRDPPKKPIVYSGGYGRVAKDKINKAKERLMEALEEERCKFVREPPISIFQADYQHPQGLPKSCPFEFKISVKKGEVNFPMYDFDINKKPMFDHVSTYKADYTNGDVILQGRPERALHPELDSEVLGAPRESLDPLKCPKDKPPKDLSECFDYNKICSMDSGDPIQVIYKSSAVPERTEENERWGQDWECCLMERTDCRGC